MNIEPNASNGTIQGKKDLLMKDIKSVVGDADELLKEVANSTAAGVAVARTKMGAKFGEAKSRLDDARITALTKAKGAAEATNVYVRDNPWKALGVATAAGLIIGVLLRRR